MAGSSVVSAEEDRLSTRDTVGSETPRPVRSNCHELHLHPKADAQRAREGHKLPSSGLCADVADSGERREGLKSQSVNRLTPRDMPQEKDGYSNRVKPRCC